MTINEIKSKVYRKAGVSGTAELKRTRKDLTQGKDLRYKSSWQQILETLEDDYSFVDLVHASKELQQSMHRVGRAMGQSYQEIEEALDKIEAKPLEQIFSEIEQDYLASSEVK